MTFAQQAIEKAIKSLFKCARPLQYKSLFFNPHKLGYTCNYNDSWHLHTDIHIEIDFEKLTRRVQVGWPAYGSLSAAAAVASAAQNLEVAHAAARADTIIGYLLHELRERCTAEEIKEAREAVAAKLKADGEAALV